MKLLTLNFLTCALKPCKTNPLSFPLHPRSAVLETIPADLNLPFLQNILPRLMWPELRTIAMELGLPPLPEQLPAVADLVVRRAATEGREAAAAAAGGQEGGGGEVDALGNAIGGDEEDDGDDEEQPSQTARDLHAVLLETCVQEGSLVCAACGHEYLVKEGVANFLLPGHLV